MSIRLLGEQKAWPSHQLGELMEFTSCYNQHEVPSLEVWLRDGCKALPGDFEQVEWRWGIRTRDATL